MPLDPVEFERLFEEFEASAFRLQRLPVYDVASEQEDLALYRAGERMPERRETPWLATMKRHLSMGHTWTNVHLLSDPLTPYLGWLIEWWYVYYERLGARIGFLGAKDASRMQELAPEDFWLFDDRLLVRLRYDAEGRFLEAEVPSAPAALEQALAARDYALVHAATLQTILAKHRLDKRS